MKKFILLILSALCLCGCTKVEYSDIIVDKFITYKHNGRAKEYVFVLKEYKEHTVQKYEFDQYKIGDTFTWYYYKN